MIAEPLGGSALAQGAIAGLYPQWYGVRPSTADGWRGRARDAVGTVPSDWYQQLQAAFGFVGETPGAARLARTAAAGGVVVTTGQQPGLFGGPLYTLSKALGALAYADAHERLTGISTAPVFWAATDDADFAEASFAWLATTTGAVRVALDQVPTESIPMARVPLQGVTDALEELTRACGSAADASALRAAVAAYGRHGATIGGAYIEFMRRVLEPLGIAVLDASHPSLLRREYPLLESAVGQAASIHQALEARERALRLEGFEPQVAGGRLLSLVFDRDGERKVRLPVGAERDATAAGRLSPNVLLRPVAEAAVLPTVAYVAGPGEMAYFAQVGAVADALGVRAPLALPRWSCTVLDVRLSATLETFGLSWRDLERAHDVERRIALRSVSPGLLEHLRGMREQIRAMSDGFQQALVAAGSPIDPRTVDGARRAMTWRVERLERRLVAAAKQHETGAMQRVAAARGALFPGGVRQERALNFVPLLAVWGAPLLDRMSASAVRHATAVLRGEGIPVDP